MHYVCNTVRFPVRAPAKNSVYAHKFDFPQHRLASKLALLFKIRKLSFPGIPWKREQVGQSPSGPKAAVLIPELFSIYFEGKQVRRLEFTPRFCAVFAESFVAREAASKIEKLIGDRARGFFFVAKKTKDLFSIFQQALCLPPPPSPRWREERIFGATRDTLHFPGKKAFSEPDKVSLVCRRGTVFPHTRTHCKKSPENHQGYYSLQFSSLEFCKSGVSVSAWQKSIQKSPCGGGES